MGWLKGMESPGVMESLGGLESHGSTWKVLTWKVSKVGFGGRFIVARVGLTTIRLVPECTHRLKRVCQEQKWVCCY